MKKIIKTSSYIIIFFATLVLGRSVSAAISIRPALNLGLVGYWSMDEGTGTVVNDQSGNSYSGTINGGYTGSVIATDNFNRADANPIGGNWTTVTGAGNLRIVSNEAKGSAAGVNAAYWNANTPGDNQYSQVKTTNVTSSAMPVVRASTTANTFYGARISGSYYSIFKSISGIVTNLFTGTVAPVAGDIVRLEAIGTTIVLTVNGTYRITAVDTDISSGMLGIRINDTTAAADDWEGGNLTTDSQAIWADGKLGKGLSFNGANNYIDLSSTYGGRSYGDFTISTWYKSAHTAVSDDQNIIETFEVGDDEEMDFGPTDDAGNADKLRISIGRNGTWNDYYGTSDVVDQSWHYLTVARTSSRIKIYVDGILESDTADAEAGVSIGINTNPVFYIGDDPGVTEQVYGNLDELRLYSRALSATEVARLYNLTRPKFKAASSLGLVGYWAMDEGQGTIAGDMSGKGHNGTLSGSTLPSWIDGKRGEALSFGGANGYVQTPAIPSGVLVYDYFTYAAWVKPNFDSSYSGGQEPIIHWGDTNDPRLYLRFEAGNWLYMDNGPGNTIDYGKMYWNGALFCSDYSCTPPVYAAGDWILIVATGRSRQSLENEPILIGSGNPTHSGRYFNGLMDEVRIYNRALSAAEVADLYNSSKKILKTSASQNNKLTTGLVGMWSFNGPDMSGVTVFDRGSGGNNGTLVGSPVVTIGKVGQAIDLNGSAQRVYVGSPASLDNMTTLTWTAWARAEGNPNNNYGPIISKANGSTERKKFQFTQSNPGSTMNAVGATFVASTTDAVSLSVNGTYSLNEWAFWTMTYDDGGDRKIRIYKNGVEVSYATQQAAVDPLTSDASEFLIIGGMAPAGFYSFNGVLDEVRVYNRVLTAAEIKRLYEMGK